MADYIVIDGGTTNTRINLVRDYKIIDSLKFPVGARLNIENPNLLRDTVKSGIADILKNNNMAESQIRAILASGMITSEHGLCNLSHLTLPVGKEELHRGMEKREIKEISSIPFYFVRGIKTKGENLDEIDMMRGEETELFGISDGQEGVYVLPGSHSKIITTNSENKIINIKTMLTGEMLASLSENTVLKSSVDIKTNKIDEAYLFKGFELCRKSGLNNALFKTRILDTILNKNKAQVYSYYMGVILCEEIEEIIKLKPKSVKIGGKKHIKEPMAMLLRRFSEARITEISDSRVDNSSLGIVEIFEC